MRKLEYDINMDYFREIKDYIVPVLFTQHQFGLIEKKAAGQKLTDSERNEFSRAISRKMKAVNAIMEKETGNIFVYGKERMIQSRLEKAKECLKEFSRKFKGKHIIISGSFLYNERYNDIDVFVVSRYEKEDYKEGEFHINYLTEDVYDSVFFASIRKLCLSNKKIRLQAIKEEINIESFVYTYQELFGDLDKKFVGIRATLRDFLLESAFLSKSQIPDSFDIKQKIDIIMNAKRPKEIIKKIFVNSIVLGAERTEAVRLMEDMIRSYGDIMKEYKKHKDYYLDLIDAFREVISIES